MPSAGVAAARVGEVTGALAFGSATEPSAVGFGASTSPLASLRGVVVVVTPRDWVPRAACAVAATPSGWVCVRGTVDTVAASLRGVVFAVTATGPVCVRGSAGLAGAATVVAVVVRAKVWVCRVGVVGVAGNAGGGGVVGDAVSRTRAASF